MLTFDPVLCAGLLYTQRVDDRTVQPETPESAEPGELRLGQTPRGTAANEAIIALTRAARSFLLYDPANEAIRQFLLTLRGAVERYVQVHGELCLAVRPFELLNGGEVVYLDRDRERSLAFRLYRDGIRKVTLGSDVPWSEVLKLLEVLSIRFIGVRQSEDDMVVLLWKAGFQHIQVEAVEGFVPDEEVGELGEEGHVEDLSTGRPLADAPADFDLPVPEFNRRQPVVHQELPDTWRQGLLLEDGMQHVPDHCLRLVGHMLAAVEDPTDPLTFTEIVPQLREIRDFILTEAQLALVVEVVRRIAGASLERGAMRERDVLLASFGEEASILRLLHSLSPTLETAPPELITLFQLLPGNHLSALAAGLDGEHGRGRARVIRSLIERYVMKEGEAIVDRIVTAPAPLACELLRTLRYVSLSRAVDAVRGGAARTELEFQEAALRVLELAPVGAGVASLFAGYTGSPHTSIRLRTLALVGERRIQAVFPVMLDRLRTLGLRGLPPAEAEALGEAMATSDPARALEVYREWIRPKGFFAALAPPALQWVAVSGLVLLPGDEPEALIKIASDKGGSDLQRHCSNCMVKRRRLLRATNPPGRA